MPVENLLSPDTARRVLWSPPDGEADESMAAALADRGARPWQIELTVPVLAAALDAAGRQPSYPPVTFGVGWRRWPPDRPTVSCSSTASPRPRRPGSSVRGTSRAMCTSCAFTRPDRHTRGSTSVVSAAPSATSTPSGSTAPAPRTLRDVVFVEGVRTPFGKAGDKGQYAQTRADDLVVKVIRELLRRQPGLPPERIDEVAIAAATQTGDQGLTIGRTAAILAGLPRSVPGFAIDRMCAGAMTAVTTVASGIAVGAYDAVIAGGVEHMGHHPMGEGADPNPRFVADRLVDPSALNDGLDRGEPARPLPAADQGARGRVRGGQPGEVRQGVGQRQDRTRPGPGGDPLGRAGLGTRRRRRDAPSRNNSRSARRPCARRSGRTAG